MRLATVLLAAALAGAGLAFAAGEAQACRLDVAGTCVLPGGGGGCDPETGACYPCDPRPGHPFDCW